MDTENALVTPPSANPSIRSVDVNRSVEWLAAGFRMVMKAPGSWAVITIALIGGAMLLGFILPDWLSEPLVTVLGIVVLGALMRSCQALDEGRDIASGAQAALSLVPLWILGVIAALMSFAMTILGGLFGLSSLAVLLMDPSSFIQVLGFGGLVLLAAAILMGMAMWLAPALVVLKGVNPLDAVKLSLLGSLKNFLPYLVYSLLAMLLCVVGAIPIGLGLLIVIPMLICSSYLAYQAIFTA